MRLRPPTRSRRPWGATCGVPWHPCAACPSSLQPLPPRHQPHRRRTRIGRGAPVLAARAPPRSSPPRAQLRRRRMQRTRLLPRRRRALARQRSPAPRMRLFTTEAVALKVLGMATPKVLALPPPPRMLAIRLPFDCPATPPRDAGRAPERRGRPDLQETQAAPRERQGSPPWSSAGAGESPKHCAQVSPSGQRTPRTR